MSVYQMYSAYSSVSSAIFSPDYGRNQHKRGQASRSTQQLYRYNHEPNAANLLRRDIPPIVILVVFLFLIIIILSQILVVHTSRYGSNLSATQQIQAELKQMDESMETILRNNVVPIEKWRLLFDIQTYVSHYEYLFNLLNANNQSMNSQQRDYCPEEPQRLSTN